MEGARQRPVALVACLAHLGDQRRRDGLLQEAAHLVAPRELLARVGVAHQKRTTCRTCTISIFPVSPISTLITKVKNDIRSQPPSADQKPCTLKPITTLAAIHSIPAFTTSVNSPRVRMLSGRVRRRTSGRTTAFSTPIVTAAK